MKTNAMNEPRISIIKWRAFESNTLRGFADVRLPSGLILRDVSAHVKNGKAWAGLPAKPVLDENGRHKIAQDTGKKIYAPIVEWETRDLSAGFSAAVVAVLDRDHPGWQE